MTRTVNCKLREREDAKACNPTWDLIMRVWVVPVRSAKHYVALGKKGWNRSRGRSAGRNGIPREFYEVVGGRSSLSEGALVLGVAVGKVKRGS